MGYCEGDCLVSSVDIWLFDYWSCLREVWELPGKEIPPTHLFCREEIQKIVGDEEGVGGSCVAQALGLNIIKAC